MTNLQSLQARWDRLNNQYVPIEVGDLIDDLLAELQESELRT